MAAPNPPLDALFDRLQKLSPLSLTLLTALTRQIVIQQVKAKQELCSMGIHCSSIWYSVDSWVVDLSQLSIGKEEVSALYGPGDIFTDLKSILQIEPSHKRAVVITGTTLLRICRADLIPLQPELSSTNLLAKYMLELRERDHWRMELLSLSDQAKVDAFAKRYPLNHLPGYICASYLRMTPSRFSKAKTLYNRSN